MKHSINEVLMFPKNIMFVWWEYFLFSRSNKLKKQTFSLFIYSHSRKIGKYKKALKRYDTSEITTDLYFYIYVSKFKSFFLLQRNLFWRLSHLLINRSRVQTTHCWPHWPVGEWLNPLSPDPGASGWHRGQGKLAFPRVPGKGWETVSHLCGPNALG